MATRQHYGSAELEYEGASGAVIHLLAVPLTINPRQGFQSTHLARRWEGWSASGRAREVFTLGASVDEIVGTIRFEDEPVALRDLLRAGLEDNEPLIYRPTGAYGEEIECLLVEIVGAGPDEITLTPDRDRGDIGEWEVTIRLRRVDGGTFEGIL